MKPKGWCASSAKEGSEKRTHQVIPSLKLQLIVFSSALECCMVAVTLFDIVGGVDAMEMIANC